MLMAREEESDLHPMPAGFYSGLKKVVNCSDRVVGWWVLSLKDWGATSAWWGAGEQIILCVNPFFLGNESLIIEEFVFSQVFLSRQFNESLYLSNKNLEKNEQGAVWGVKRQGFLSRCSPSDDLAGAGKHTCARARARRFPGVGHSCVIKVSEWCEDGSLALSSFPELGRKHVIDDQKQRPLRRSNQWFFLSE